MNTEINEFTRAFSFTLKYFAELYCRLYSVVSTVCLPNDLFIYFILKFKRHAVKTVMDNDDVKDALFMVITLYETAHVTPALIKVTYKYTRNIIFK